VNKEKKTGRKAGKWYTEAEGRGAYTCVVKEEG
jgi:hypothetical protein